MLDILGIDDLFDDVFCIERANFQPKPDASGFLRLLNDHRLHPKRCVMVEDSLLLDISNDQFFKLHVDFPRDFGLLMINLARELAREIEMLENVIVAFSINTEKRK